MVKYLYKNKVYNNYNDLMTRQNKDMCIIWDMINKMYPNESKQDKERLFNVMHDSSYKVINN